MLSANLTTDNSTENPNFITVGIRTKYLKSKIFCFVSIRKKMPKIFLRELKNFTKNLQAEYIFSEFWLIDSFF